MSNSLADQLLKAGVIDEKKAKKAQKNKQRQHKLERHGNIKHDNETLERRKQAAAAAADRDRELNRLRHEAAQRKAVHEQIKHLVEKNRVVCTADEIAYHFTHDGKVKRLYVDQRMHTQLTQGQLAVVALDGKYEAVPAKVADKIAQRDTGCVLVAIIADAPPEADPNDPYADFKVPDDLIW